MSRAARAAALAALCVALGAPAGAVAPSWGRAMSVRLPAGGLTVPQGYLPGLACPTQSSCVAVGNYSDGASTYGLVSVERAGAWRAVRIAAPSDASAQPGLTPTAVACGAPGTCLAVGSYLDGSDSVAPFLAAEVAGRWGAATRAPLPADAATVGQSAFLRAVACPSARWCVAVGSYVVGTSALPVEGLAVDGAPGAWRASALDAPAPANADPAVALGQVACAAPRACAAAGTDLGADGQSAGLVAADSSGAWSTSALALPPDASAYPAIDVAGVACPGAASCVAAGAYETATGGRHAFATSLATGVATEVAMPAGAAANPRVFFYGFSDLACATPGQCAFGGQYRDAQGRYQGFLADDVGGAWRAATRLRLPAGAAQAGHNGGVVAVACPGVGSCRAGAAYLDARGRYQAYVVGERANAWTEATTLALPGRSTTVGVDGGVYGLACASYSRCTAAGSYLDHGSIYQGFIARLG